MTRTTKILAMLCVIASLAFSGGAAADILSGTGSGAVFAKLFPIDSPPPTHFVGSNNWNVDGVFWGFNEKFVTLGAPLNVFSGNDGSLPTTLAVGTQLTSHYIFYDPNDVTGGSFTGTVKFKDPIIGVLWSSADVTGSNSLFGLQGVTYNSHLATGLEATDLFSFAGDTLTLNWGASNPGDHIRVLTAAVPEPETYLMMLAGLAALAGLAYRRTRS